MSTNLLAKLRYRKTVYHGYKQSHEELVNPAGPEAANYIEELETKLAKAVNRLTEMRDDDIGYRHVSHFRRGTAITLALLDHPAPAPTADQTPKQFEFDHPYSAVFKDGLVGRWLELRAHGVSVASFAVAAWGSEPACIAAAWRHVYGDDAPSPTPSHEAVVKAALKWAAKRIVTHERGSVMHSPPALLTEAHDTLCDAASDPATRAAIIKTAGGKKDE
jgi:hypothetical protein